MISAKVVGVTMPTPKTGLALPEELVSYCARVSNPKNQLKTETADGLLSYCFRKQHWSIFEMTDAVMEITAPRDISRQMIRHASFRFQEFSLRYAEAPGLDYREPRFEHPSNRQSSIPFDLDDDAHGEIWDWWYDGLAEIIEHVEWFYREARKRGVAKECARVVLPEGLTPSTLYMKGSLRSWLHYCDLRSGNGTQLEHQAVARAALEELTRWFPATTKAYFDQDRG